MQTRYLEKNNNSESPEYKMYEKDRDFTNSVEEIYKLI